MAARQAQLKLDFLVVGGGISGLTAAYGLARSGHHVRVLEKADSVIRNGGVVLLAPNTVQTLARWGLEEEIAKRASPIRATNIFDARNDSKIGHIEWADDVVKESGGTWYALNHPDLIDIFYRSLLDFGVEILTSAPAASVEPPSPTAVSRRPRVILQDGRTFDADIVIGADGQYSAVRRVICEVHGSWTGKNVLTGAIPIAVVQQDAKLNQDGVVWGAPAWVGTDLAMYGCATAGDKEYCVQVNWNAEGDAMEDSWDYIYSTEALGLEQRELTDRAKRLIRHTKKMASVRWMTWPNLESWIDNSKTAVLIGESARSMVPCTMSASANPIESAAVFATLFSYLRTTDQIPIFIAAYETLRKSRAEELHAREKEAVDLFQVAPGAAREARDVQLRAAMEQRSKGWDDVSLIQQWAEICHVWAYNAVDAADAWWLEWGLLRERALVGECPDKAAAAGVKFDPLQVQISA